MRHLQDCNTRCGDARAQVVSDFVLRLREL
jgi:hypothetical protein